LPVSTARTLQSIPVAPNSWLVGDETPWNWCGIRFAEDADQPCLVTKLLSALGARRSEYHDVVLASVKDAGDINDKTKPCWRLSRKYTNLPVDSGRQLRLCRSDGKLDVKNVGNQIGVAAGAGLVDKGLRRTRLSRRNM